MKQFKNSHWPIIFAGVFCTLGFSVASATDNEGADRQEDSQDGYKWGVGVGANLKKSLYKGISTDNSYLPVVSFESKYVRLFGNVVDLKLPSVGPLDFSLRAKASLGGGYQASKSSYLTGMQSRKGAIFVGAATTWDAGFADISFDYLADVSGNSKGSELQLGIEHSFNFERKFQVTPHASIVRQDAKLVDYYYGVRASEATTTRPEYRGKSTTETEFGVRFGYLMTPKQKLLVDVSDEHFGSGITNSPIVDKKTTPKFLLGYLYSF